MPETKSEVYHRLVHEGRWGEASEYRDRIRRQLRDCGMRKAESNDESWRRMAIQFLPMDSITALNGQLDGVPADDSDLPTGLPVGDSNFDRDFEWAYNNLGAELEPSAAPSGAAWLLREIGRSPKGRDKFVAMAQKTLSKKNDTENEKKNREDRSRQFAILHSIKRSFAGPEGEPATKR